DANRPYRMPAAGFLTPAAFVIANLLIYWSGFEVVWKLGIVLVIGYVLIGISMAFDKQRPPLDWGSAIWLPVWLIGLGILSWQARCRPRPPRRPLCGWSCRCAPACGVPSSDRARAPGRGRKELPTRAGGGAAHGEERETPRH